MAKGTYKTDGGTGTRSLSFVIPTGVKVFGGFVGIEPPRVSLNADFLPEAGDKAFKDGEIANLDGLTKMLERDEFDLVAVGRAIIANPDWAQLLKAGQFDKLANFEKKMLMSLVS